MGVDQGGCAVGRLDLRRGSDVVDDGLDRRFIEDHCGHVRRLGALHRRRRQWTAAVAVDEGGGGEAAAGEKRQWVRSARRF